MLVLKFGGTSVGSPPALEKVVEILKDPVRREKVGVVVVSAFSGVTDKLIDLSRRAVSGDTTYSKTVIALKESHLEIASHFLSGMELEAAWEKIEEEFSQLLKALDGISVLRELSPRSLDLVMSFG